MNRFTVIDACDAYYLLDAVTNREACMGDGVDTECYGGIGTEEFRLAWEGDANDNAKDYLEAYFHNLHELKIYDNPNFIDRYTVILEEASSLEKSLQCCADLHYCLGLSIYPDSPQGFSQHSYASPAAMKGTKRIHFLDLPKNVQAHLVERLEDE